MPPPKHFMVADSCLILLVRVVLVFSRTLRVAFVYSLYHMGTWYTNTHFQNVPRTESCHLAELDVVPWNWACTRISYENSIESLRSNITQVIQRQSTKHVGDRLHTGATSCSLYDVICANINWHSQIIRLQ